MRQKVYDETGIELLIEVQSIPKDYIEKNIQPLVKQETTKWRSTSRANSENNILR